ncbi:hypothetical protein I4U23_025294 [Adineta vaga]|nr:hypothetical protein I4U23_025294 [Adineta vaga]
MMNISNLCSYNSSSCYFIDIVGNCLSDSSVNDLILKYVLPTSYEWICIVLYLIVFIVGTIGNILVIIVIQRNRSMRTVTNMFIMNLAAADLLVLLFCLPATVIQDVTKTWFFGLILCKFVNYIQNMSISVSVLTLMGISIERYQAIVYPLKFSGTKQRARILILSIWLLSIVLVLPDAIMMTLSRQYGDRLSTIYLTYCQWNAHPLFDLVYQLHISLCLFIIPLCLMVYTYTGVARVLWGSLPSEQTYLGEKRKRNSSLMSHGDDINNNLMQNSTKSSNIIVQETRQKAAKMLISVVIIFTICYIPVHVFNLFRYIYTYMEHVKLNKSNGDQVECFEPKIVYLERTGTTKIVTISALISHFLPYFNSSINPIIYNIMSDKFRLKFRELFSSCCEKTVAKTKSSSTKMHFKTSGIVQNSPNSTTFRSSTKTRHTRNSANVLNHLNGGGQMLANTNVNLTRHNGMNIAAHDNGPTCFRLTNV